MSWRWWLAIVVGVLAMGYQLCQLALIHLAARSQGNVNTAKLQADLRSPEYKVRQAATSSLFMLAGVDQYRPQLIKAGIHRQLAGQVLIAGLDDPSLDLLPLALLTLAKMTKATPDIAANVMTAHMPERMMEIIKKGVPGWTASLSQLLHALCTADTNTCKIITDKLLSRQKELQLVAATVGLLQSGGLSKEAWGKDALVSGCRLMELLATHSADAREGLVDNNVSRLLVQVLNSGKVDSLVVAAVAQALTSLVSRHTASVEELARQGVTLPLCQEMRNTNKHSLGPVLSLMSHLIHHEDVQGEAVSSGLLSMCAQVLFQKSEDSWRVHCVSMLCDVAGEAAADELAGKLSKQQTAGVTCMMAMINQDRNVPLHGSAIEAMRDVGTSRAACDELVSQGVLSHLTVLLSGDIPTGLPQTWLMQTQRSAAMLVALLALQDHIRPKLVQAGMIEALASCVRNHAEGPAIRQQLRITAAAAFVPILTMKDDRYDIRTVESGVMETLVHMVFSATEQERNVAGKVLGLLKRQKVVQEMFDGVGLELPAE